MLNFLKKIALLLFSMALFIAVFEFSLRFIAKKSPLPRIHDFIYIDSDGCIRIDPNVSGLHKTYDGKDQIKIDINSAGLRGPELRLNPKKRVAFVGDSIVFDGGNPWENTFPALLGIRIHTWEFLNFGISDSGLKEYHCKIRHHALLLKPDLIVVGLYLNDTAEPQDEWGHGRRFMWSRLNRLISAQYVNRLLKTIFTSRAPHMKDRFRWVKRYADQHYLSDESDWKNLVFEADLDWGAAWLDSFPDELEKAFTDLKELCANHNVKLGVMMFPVRPQLYIDRKFWGANHPQIMAARVMKKLDIPFFDLLPLFRKHRNRMPVMDQCHLSSEGNKLVAEGIAPWLKGYK